MSEESQSAVSTASTDRSDKPRPADFWVGVALLATCFVLFVYSAGAGSGEPEKGAVKKPALPAVTKRKESPTKKAPRENVLAEVERLEAEERLEEALAELQGVEQRVGKTREVEEAETRIREAQRQREKRWAADCIAGLRDGLRGGDLSRDEAKEAVDTFIESVTFTESARDLEAFKEEIRSGNAEAGAETGPPVFMRPKAKLIDLASDRVVVLPVDTWAFYRLHRDESRISASLFEGCLKAFGSAGISIEPARAVLESAGLWSVGRRLAYGAFHMIDFHQSFDLSEDSCGRKIEEVPGMVTRLARLLEKELALDFRPRYFFALAVNSHGPNEAKTHLKYRVSAALFDATKRLVHSCAFYSGEVPLDMTKAQGKIAAIPDEVIGALLAKATKNGY
jgi:hypothetical protein